MVRVVDACVGYGVMVVHNSVLQPVQLGAASVHPCLQEPRNPWPAGRRSDGTIPSTPEPTTSFRAGRDRSRGQSSDRLRREACQRFQTLKSSGLSAVKWRVFEGTAMVQPDPGRVGRHRPFAEWWQVVVREDEGSGRPNPQRIITLAGKAIILGH